MKREVIIHPYDPAWPQQFAEEAARLRPIFGANLITIHHIGSTAVPGLPAKPTLDLMPIVHELAPVDGLTPALAELGYIAKGENGIPGRRYFRKGSDAFHTHHVHVFAAGHPNIAQHLAFRDYLRAHPEEATAYGRLKQRLAAQFRADPPAYTAAKAPFIATILQKTAGDVISPQQQ